MTTLFIDQLVEKLDSMSEGDVGSFFIDELFRPIKEEPDVEEVLFDRDPEPSYPKPIDDDLFAELLEKQIQMKLISDWMEKVRPLAHAYGRAKAAFNEVKGKLNEWVENTGSTDGFPWNEHQWKQKKARRDKAWDAFSKYRGNYYRGYELWEKLRDECKELGLRDLGDSGSKRLWGKFFGEFQTVEKSSKNRVSTVRTIDEDGKDKLEPIYCLDYEAMEEWLEEHYQKDENPGNDPEEIDDQAILHQSSNDSYEGFLTKDLIERYKEDLPLSKSEENPLFTPWKYQYPCLDVTDEYILMQSLEENLF